MRVHNLVAMIALTSALLAGPVQADKGKNLHDKNCTKCHSTEVFTREDRGIKNVDALKTRVKQCTGAAGVEWDSKEVNIVTDYLNREFYKF